MRSEHRPPNWNLLPFGSADAADREGLHAPCRRQPLSRSQRA